jgi:hypothetical protein
MDVDDILTGISEIIADMGQQAGKDRPRGAVAHPAARGASDRQDPQDAVELDIPDEPVGPAPRSPAAAPGKGSGGAEGRKGGEAKADTAVESYQCLICGSTIPAEAEHCRICGTIFVDEKEAGSYKGIPVARICQSSEIDPEDNDLRQMHRTEEIKVASPLPAQGMRPQRLTAEEMPSVEYGQKGGHGHADEIAAAEFDTSKRSLIKKKVIKKKV